MGLTAFNRMRREAAAAAQNIAPPVVTNTADEDIDDVKNGIATGQTEETKGEADADSPLDIVTESEQDLEPVSIVPRTLNDAQPEPLEEALKVSGDEQDSAPANQDISTFSDVPRTLNDVQPADPGKSESQLNRMNKAELVNYAYKLGLAFLEDMTKQQMIEEIQAKEAKNNE